VVHCASDPIFQAAQDLATNAQLANNAESTISSCETELAALQGVASGAGSVKDKWWRWIWSWEEDAVDQRARHVRRRMKEAQAKLEALERRNAELRKVLAKGERLQGGQ